MAGKTLGIIGAGTMGAGIAYVAALAGFDVVLSDIEDRFVQGGLNNIEASLKKGVEKSAITGEQASAALGKIKGRVGLVELAGQSNFVIEAAIEDMNIKKQIFQELDTRCAKNVILASNTSSLSITELATATARPEKVIGMHFFNPVRVMKLVEVIRGQSTADETVQKTKELAVQLDKVPVEVREAPGFVVNRILNPLINEAICALADGVASAEDIDTALKLGANHPMGPLALADLVGLDVVLAVCEELYHEFGDPKYRPSPLLRKMVRAGHLGRKTGRGFFEYKK